MNPPFSNFNSNLSKQNQYGTLQSYHQSMPSLFANLSAQRKIYQRQTVSDLKNKMNNYNNELLLPRCMQKTFTRKFTLSPLTHQQKPTQHNFKLKNLQMKKVNDYDCPVQEDQQQPNTQINQHFNNDSLNTTNFTKFRSTSKFGNKQNLSYQNQVVQMLITQSKLKYQPKNRLKNHKISTKKSLDLNYDQTQKLNQTNSFKTNHDLNKTKSQISFRTFFTTKKSFKADQNNDLLNSTRTKLLSHLNETPKINLTKADLFPLQRLLEKKNRKLNFRNKWFNQKTIKLEQKL